jgi:transposase
MSTTNNTQKPKRYYDEQLKHDAVQRVILTGKSCVDVGQELGIDGHLIAKWKRVHLHKADHAAGDSLNPSPSELAEQLRQAQKENADLRMQRDILKKALSIFSQLPPEGGRS